MVIKKSGGLSEFFSETFTIFNQIPTSSTDPTKRAWKKAYISQCDRKDGIFDRSTGTMFYKANAFTALTKDVGRYKAPNFVDGFYTLTDDIMTRYFTADIGDLIIFAEVDDPEPQSVKEFSRLRDKYKDMGGILTSVTPYLHFKPDGTPWRTNHIEMVKG